MKKKKLKKRLKELEKTVCWHTDAQRSLALKYDTIQHQNENLKEAITKLENDNKYYKEWMDRSGVDYKSWFNFDEKTCDTCDYPGLSGCGTQCVGCPANKKEDDTNGN